MPPKAVRGSRSAASTGATTRQTRSATAAEAPKRKADRDELDGAQPKRQRRTQTTRKGVNKKPTRQKLKTKASSGQGEPILVNRAPVLELWGSCVAHTVHPELPWQACLSIGKRIAAITAISKGRSIGTIPQPDKDEKKDGKKKSKADGGERTIRVMGFAMPMDGDEVVAQGRAKKGSEESLARRFGHENLHRVRSAMESALQTWKGHEDELEKQAFSMYEEFRPDVAAGQKGWGRKGELRLDAIEAAVQRASG